MVKQGKVTVTEQYYAYHIYINIRIPYYLTELGLKLEQVHLTA